MLPIQEAWVQSLVRELRSHMLRGMAKKLKKKKKTEWILKEYKMEFIVLRLSWSKPGAEGSICLSNVASRL